MSGVEALLRWHHPIHGLVAAGEVIALAERTGLIHDLTHWVISTALTDCANWQKQGIQLHVAVNLSVYDLRNMQLVKHVRETLDATNLTPKRLVLEVTESSMMDNTDQATSTLSQLDRMGVAVSIDDFGTGYSSLAYLSKFPVRELKLDQTFVTRMELGGRDAAIVHAMIDLGHELGLRIVAEGVESHAVLCRLLRANADVAQGMHICEPLPADRLLD